MFLQDGSLAADHAKAASIDARTTLPDTLMIDSIAARAAGQKPLPCPALPCPALHCPLTFRKLPCPARMDFLCIMCKAHFLCCAELLLFFTLASKAFPVVGFAKCAMMCLANTRQGLVSVMLGCILMLVCCLLGCIVVLFCGVAEANADVVAAYWDMGKDWLNDKVGTNLPGSNSLTGRILFQHHRASSNQPDQPGGLWFL